MFGMMLIAGANPKLLGGCFGGVGLVVVLLWLHFSFNLPLPLKEYQIMRLMFLILMPMVKRFGYGYNIIQSLVAVGSGGVRVKDYLTAPRLS